MAENRFPCPSVGAPLRESVCIDTNRVLDSCRDRDCFENVRVYLSSFGNEILERTGAIRARSAKIVWSYIGLEPIPFNRGFFAITVRFYVKLVFEACIGCGRSQDIEGIAVLEKRVILYGGESNVTVFKSNGHGTDDFCACPSPECGEQNAPVGVVEVVSPVILGTKIVEHVSECNCCCCCCENDLPAHVTASLEAPLCFDDTSFSSGNGKRSLTVSLGIFSVIRIVRPAQYTIQAVECAIPEKECAPVDEDDPCRVFRNMPFPTGEFSVSGGIPVHPLQERGGRCGCGS